MIENNMNIRTAKNTKIRKRKIIWGVILGLFFVLLSQPLAAKIEDTVPLVNPIGGTVTDSAGEINLYEIVGSIIKKVLGLMGSLALLVFIYGGFMWLTATGNSDRVKQGTNAMLWATIGILVIFSSYAILSLILKGIGATG